MKRALGRAYPAAIQGEIDALGLRIDALLPAALDFSISSGTDAQRAVSTLNARLVNEVVIVAAQVTDAEARVRIAAVEKDALSLQKKASEGSIHKDAVRILSKDQVLALVAAWNRAFDAYDDVTKRVGRLKQGTLESAAYADVALSLQMLDTDILWTKDAFEQLADLADGRDDVEIESGTFLKMASWLTEAISVDNRLRRLEGRMENRPARAIPAVSAASPWLSIIGATAGLGGIGVVLWMSTARN